MMEDVNKKLAFGLQTAFDIDVVNTGVSRKDFDEIIRENIESEDGMDLHAVSVLSKCSDILLWYYE